MAACVFPFNPVLAGMEYKDSVLTLEFKKKTGNERRKYADVPTNVAYGLFYRRTGTDVLMYFAKYIKKQYKVLEVSKC
jgi:hypothetical protein